MWVCDLPQGSLQFASERYRNALIASLLEVVTLAQARNTSDIEAGDRVEKQRSDR